jgi:hypothetical protein
MWQTCMYMPYHDPSAAMSLALDFVDVGHLCCLKCLLARDFIVVSGSPVSVNSANSASFW